MSIKFFCFFYVNMYSKWVHLIIYVPTQLLMYIYIYTVGNCFELDGWRVSLKSSTTWNCLRSTGIKLRTWITATSSNSLLISAFEMGFWCSGSVLLSYQFISISLLWRWTQLVLFLWRWWCVWGLWAGGERKGLWPLHPKRLPGSMGHCRAGVQRGEDTLSSGGGCWIPCSDKGEYA